MYRIFNSLDKFYEVNGILEEEIKIEALEAIVKEANPALGILKYGETERDLKTLEGVYERMYATTEKQRQYFFKKRT